MEYQNYKQILDIIAKAGKAGEIVEIYYPKTENSSEGWRQVEPYSLTTDIGIEGEHLIYGKDRLSQGHIFNGYTIGKGGNRNFCHSFIIGKIKLAKLTSKKFIPRNNWKIEF
ncbi:MAG: hypothetical protein ABH956_00340 [Candidatus Nealsonbacteria bacterium]